MLYIICTSHSVIAVTAVDKPDGSTNIEWVTEPDLTYMCSVNDNPPVSCEYVHQRLCNEHHAILCTMHDIPGDSPYILREEDIEAASTRVRVVSFRGMTQVGVVGEAVVNSCKLTGITPPDRMCTCYSTLYRHVYLYSHCMYTIMLILRVEKAIILCLIFII